MLEFLVAPMHYQFFVHGLYAALLVGALCGLIGVYITLRGMSYIGHGLSHAAFGGAVVSYVMGVNFYIGATLWGFLAAVLINKVAGKHKIKADAAIGVVTTASFAIGVALISRVRQFTKNFEAALFGNILGITTEDLQVILFVTLFSFVVIFLFYKQFLFVTFDKETAKVYGIQAEWMDTFFALILAAAIIASMQVIGVTMIAAAIVIPAITARLLTDSFSRMLIYSSLLGAFTTVVGMYASFYFDAASGATIVIFAAILFSLVMFIDFLRTRFRAPAGETVFQKEIALGHEHPHRHEGVLHIHEHEDVVGHEHHVGEEAREKVVLSVSGMTCDHCVRSVERWVGSLDGVEEIQVSLPDQRVEVRYRPSLIDVDRIKGAILEAGYGVA
ncbi:MAG: copper ion binding protein [Nitrospirae bacterium]|nr:copper ion binding protein [Nitrospirota bacterium]